MDWGGKRITDPVEWSADGDIDGRARRRVLIELFVLDMISLGMSLIVGSENLEMMDV